MSTGWIKLHRSSMDNGLYFAETFTKSSAWIDLLLLANYQNNTVCVRGIMLNVKRGDVLAGEDFLAKRWKWSRGKVHRFLKYLASKPIHQIEQQKSNVCSMITILNYKVYQRDDTTDGTPSSTPSSTTDGQQTVQQTDTLKKDKKEKKEKNNNISEDAKHLARLLIDEVSKAQGRKLVSKPASGYKPIQMLINSGVAPEKIELTIKWLTTINMQSNYSYVVQSGTSLREKWDSIQSAMNKTKHKERRIVL